MPAAVADVATSDYIVTFAPSTTAAERSSILASGGASVVDTIAPLRLAVVRVPDGSSVVDTLRASAGVVRVERDAVRVAEAAPGDPEYDAQWSLPRIGWDRVYGTVHPKGSAVVAVLDTGVDAAHADLAGQLVGGISELPGGDPRVDPNGHGTAMAGIIAAVTDNGRGIAGIGFDGVKVMPVTVLDAGGLGQDSDIIEGIVWAVDHGADVINMSFSNPGFSSSLQAAIDYAWDHDVVVVAATGNDGSSSASYPAGDRSVVGVSSTDEADQLDSDSNHGADTFIGAPGEGIRTLAAGGGTATVSGTSAASAEVAAAAALLRAIDPGASNGVIVGRLGRSAADVGTRDETGNGRLDLARAAADDGTTVVRPAGVGGSGGPFVGPYVAAKKNLQITILGGIAPGFVAFSNMNPTGAFPPCLISCVTAVDNDQRGTLTVTPAPGFVFVGWSGTFDSGGTTTCVGTTSPCSFFMSNSAQHITATFLETSPFPAIDLQAASDSGPSNSDNVTNAATLVFDVTFDVPVTGFLANDLSNLGTATGCVIGAPAGAAAAYTVTVTGCSVGTVILRIAGGAVFNEVGGTNAPTVGPVVTIDRSGPTVTINQASTQPDPTGSSPIRFAVVFSETVSTFDAGDVVITGTAGGTKNVTVTGGGALYLVLVTGMTTNGTVIASIAAGATTGLAGNPSSASTSTDNVVTWDVGPPSVTIDQAVGQPDPTNVSPIVFTAVFTEPVTGFTSSDVTLTDSRAGTLTAVVTGGPTTYTVTVTGMTITGAVIASIAPGVANDVDGNPNLGSSSDDNVVLWDVTPPTVTIDQAIPQTDPTNVTPITFTAVFSEPVTGFATGDVAVTGTAGGTKIATITGGPVIYSVNVTGMTTSGTVTVDIPAGVATGQTGNPNAPSTTSDDTVTWNRATHLAFLQQPTDTVYGTSISPAVTVQVLDANGDLVTESSASILLTLNPAGVVLRGIDPVEAVNGIATFPNLTVSQVVGDFTLLAQSPALTDAVSEPFRMLPAPLTITADDRTKPYGTVATFAGTEFTVTGLVPGDSVDSVTLTSLGALASASAAGSPYPIIPSDEVGTGVANYTVTYVPGDLTITAAVADIAVTGYTVPYDGLPHTASGTATGAAGEDLSGLLDLSATTHTAAGSYPADGWTFHDPAGNYADASGAVDDAITPAELTVTANDQSRPYGTPNPALDATITGFVNGETEATSDVTGSPTCTTTAVASSPVSGSPYPITCNAGTLASTDYTFAFVDGELTVTPAALTITADDRTKPYGTAVTFAGTEFTASGLQGTDTVASVTLTSAGAPATATVAGSPYPIGASAAAGTGLANYDISYVDGDLTVTSASLLITADDGTKTYGQTVTFAGTEFTASGLAAADSVDTVTLGRRRRRDAPRWPGARTRSRASAAVGTGLANYAISLRQRRADGEPGRPDDHRQRPDQDVRQGRRLRRHGVHRRRPAQGPTPSPASRSSSAGAPATAPVAGSPYPITASAAVGTGLANYDITLRRRRADRRAGAADDHGERRDEDRTAQAVDLRRHRVHASRASSTPTPSTA